MLNIKNISKSFLQRGIVLDNLSLDVNKGESLAIMGPSGSGKTTLLNIIGLLDKPDSGEILFNGSPVAGFTDDESAIYRNRNIGYVFQDHLLLPYLTIYENIVLPLMASEYDMKERAEKEKQVEILMDKTGISDLKEKYPYQVSGGEAQRAALVRALANNPSVLLADEPTGALDAKNSDNLGDILTGMNMDFGITIILATHSAALASKMNRIYKLEEGKLII
jgi:lipoprotein-releasing system ATP-binding protein